jgi:hypothetical protein
MAQQAKKISRIGYLVVSDAVTESTRAEAIRRALRELGYIEGQNIAIEYRYAERKLEKRGLKFEEFAVPSGNLTMHQMVARPVDLGTYAGQSFVTGHDRANWLPSRRSSRWERPRT